MVYNVARAAALKVSIVCLVIIFNSSIVISTLVCKAIHIYSCASLRGASALAEPVTQSTQLLPQLEPFFLHLLLLNDILYLLLLQPSLSISIDYKAIVININILNRFYV
jgi:hypothetical protein